MRSNSKANKIGPVTKNPSSDKKILSTTNTTSNTVVKPKSSNSISSSKQKRAINTPVNPGVQKLSTKLPVNIPKYPSQKQQNTKPRYLKKKQEIMKQCKWGFLPFSYLASIFSYACTNYSQVYQLSRVCSFWRAHLRSQSGCYLWNFLKDGDKITNFQQLKTVLQKVIVDQQQKMSFEYEKNFTKLFNYGSTKQNIPNKLIQKLSLQLQVTLNKKSFIQPFRLRTFNFSSYLCTKIEQIKQFKYNFYTPHNMFKDNITLDLVFRSKRYKVSHSISKKYIPEEIVDGAIKQKAFNYYLDKNFVFTYFQGDDHFLYIFFQISLLQLVNIFRSIIKLKHQETLNKKIKKLPLYKQLCETQFQDFCQYVKFQADFQVHFSYHNSLKQIFNHCDTKVFPIEYDKKKAYFEVKVDDSFEKIATYKLDNKMGMSESIDDLYLLDFVLKDRDRFLIIFSGFMYARKATQKQRESIENYFDFAENDIKILESKQQKYHISFFIIQQTKKNLMKHVNFTLFA